MASKWQSLGDLKPLVFGQSKCWQAGIEHHAATPDGVHCLSGWLFKSRAGMLNEAMGPCGDCMPETVQRRVAQAQYAAPRETQVRTFPDASRTLDTFDWKRGGNLAKVKVAVEEYIADWPTEFGIFFYGNTAVGKTHLANAIWRELSENKHVLGVWISAESFREIVEAAVFQNQGEAHDMAMREINMMKTADLFFLDDIGVEGKKSGPFLAEMFGIINARRETNKPTIATSNLDIDTISKQNEWGPKIARRLIDSATKILVDAPSHVKTSRAKIPIKDVTK